MIMMSEFTNKKNTAEEIKTYFYYEMQRFILYKTRMKIPQRNVDLP
jgi:hypothetical protein